MYNNLLGDRRFSPQVRITDAVRNALKLDLRARITALEQQFGADLVLKSAVWLTVKESRSSFAIEHEEQKVDRVKRFATVIGTRTGQGESVFEQFESLQREILGPDALYYGTRKSPIFVGESRGYGDDVVHYVAPHWDDVPEYMAGLQELMRKTTTLSPIVRATLLSFGFVYIHPMVDGNGRLSRFLINDVLRRDGAIPEPFIVPISVTLQNQALRPLNYDGALEIFSKPLMGKYADSWSFGAERTGEDGVKYNLEFADYADAHQVWRYPDMTRHVEFMAQALELTVEQEMRDEARYLRSHTAARQRLKNIVDGPDGALDRIIRSVRENRGAISGKLRAEFTPLAREDLAQEVVTAIREEFPWSGAEALPESAGPGDESSPA